MGLGLSLLLLFGNILPMLAGLLKGRMSISNLVKQLREDCQEMIPGAVGHNYSEDHQSAPRARRSRPPHITGCILDEAVGLRTTICLIKSDH